MLTLTACSATYGHTTPRTTIRPPTSAKGGLPPTRCSDSSRRGAAGAGGAAGGAGGAAGGAGVEVGAGGAWVAAAALAGGARPRQASAAMQARADDRRRTVFIARSYAAGPTTDVS